MKGYLAMTREGGDTSISFRAEGMTKGIAIYGETWTISRIAETTDRLDTNWMLCHA